jgi:hypothetical protein
MYYLMGVAVDVRFRDWVLRDIESTAWIWRQGLQIGAGLLLGFVMPQWIWGGSGSLLTGLIGAPLIALIVCGLLADFRRRRAVAYYEKKWASAGQG